MRLSFIVPIYGVELYLRKCVDSLLHQDYDDYEIILVDDGGTDGCPAICDTYAAQYDNVQVVHRPNGGLSAARNSGIESAKGEYICFVDSDDYWEENMLGGLMEQVERDNLDVLRFKWQNVRLQSAISNQQSAYEVFSPYKSDPYRNDDYSATVTEGVDFLNHRLGTACYAWAYILKTEIAKNELFTEGIYFEDTDWTPRMLLQAKRITSSDMVVYNYLVREGSITNAVNRSKQKKVLDDKMRLVRTLKNYGEQSKKEGKSAKWFDRMIAATVVSICGMLACDFWYERAQYIRDLKDTKIFPLSTSKTNMFMRRKIKILNVCPTLAVWMMHIKNR